MIYGQPVTFGGASGEIDITDNGTFDVKKYATANVNVEPVLLWTNASPTSAFAAQTVSVPSGYDAYFVEIKWSTGAHISGATGINTINFANVGEQKPTISPLILSPSTFVSYREFTANSNSITFGAGYSVGSSTTYNEKAIPLRIWGVKFTVS